ncbi:hypothetical protein M422DRAFT_265237 [Sphaerobolus stellatus SS14]|uniref:Unplaced genomic scaffold SPHSTscaffold_145, whole genome shotgun sequence n=1 Tax=Sphaerobolus stellatus (strain SS14) TaxID=990650 RepID=A0A0C9UUH8_SPHS4|nr:hypothetical protein M422DRAFT_265237 [Sphaerobolus stellatus SS14]
MEMKSGDKRKSAILELLRRIWRQATGRPSNKLRAWWNGQQTLRDLVDQHHTVALTGAEEEGYWKRLDKDLNWQKIAAILREKYIKDNHEKAARNGTGRRKWKGGAERSEGEGDGDEKGLNQDEEEPKAKKPKTKLKNAKAAGTSQA